MSLLLFKERDQKLPDKAFFDTMWTKSTSGGGYFLVENTEGNFDTYECSTKIKYEDCVKDIFEIYEGGFSGRVITLFISTHCSIQNKEMEDSYTATTADGENWLTILGEGSFKNYSGANNSYLPIKRFVNFCNTAFLSKNVMDARSIANVLNNVNKQCPSGDKYLIIGSKTETIYHNLILDEDLGCYVSNDSYLPDISLEEKNYFLYALLTEAIKTGEIGEIPPKSFFEKLKSLTTIQIRGAAKVLTKEKGWPKFA